VETWEKREINKIVLKCKETVDDDDKWIVCMPEWDPDSTVNSKTLYLTFYPRALNWASPSSWLDPTGHKKWWIIGDEIVFGLQLYQLPGKCFYKSDWLDNFEDYDENSFFPNGTHKVKRWFQFRHWIMFWYANAQWGYNWAWGKPPKNPDGSDFSLDSVLQWSPHCIRCAGCARCAWCAGCAGCAKCVECIICITTPLLLGGSTRHNAPEAAFQARGRRQDVSYTKPINKVSKCDSLIRDVLRARSARRKKNRQLVAQT